MQPSALSIAKAYAIQLTRIKWQFNVPNGLLHHETPWGSYFYGFKWRDYQIPSTWLRVKETRTTDYFGNDSITSLKSYYYSPDYKHIMPVRTTVTSSTGDVTESLYKYAPDFVGNTMMTKLTNQNQIATPIETIINFKGNKIFEEKTIYNEDVNTDYKVMPIAIYAAKFPNNLPVIPAIGQLEKKISFNRYKSGKILEYAVADGPPTTLLWGYNNQKMIAKIENANYTLFHSQYTNLQTTSNNTTSTVAFNAALATLRNSVQQGSLITTYTHLPLIGVSSIVDPKNEKHTFFYDTAARLKMVKDSNDKILSENFYKYF